MGLSLKLELRGVYSERADYSRPQWRLGWDPFESNPEAAKVHRIYVQTGGVSVPVENLTSGKAALFALKNLDHINYCTVTWQDLDTTGSDATETAHVPAGGVIVLPGVDPAVQLQLAPNTANLDCKYILTQEL